MRQKLFLSMSRIKVNLIRRSGRPAFVCKVQRRWVAVGYRSRPPDWCLRLTPDHWSHAIFDYESKVSLHQSGRSAREFHLFLACNNPLAFQQHDDKLRYTHYSCRGWLWQIATLMIPVLMLVWQHAAMVRSQSGLSVWLSWAISRCYSTSLGHMNKYMVSSATDQLHSNHVGRE